MKIVMFTNTYLPHVGGVARSVSTFTEALKKNGHSVMVVAPQTGDAQDSTDDVLRVPAVQNFNGSDFSFKLPFSGEIAKAVTDFAPDIIHSHHPFLLGDSALRMARRLDCPVVFTHHTLYEHYVHYVPFESESLKKLAIALATEYANLCSAVLAPSESVRQLIIERGVVSPSFELPTGIDVAAFASGDGDTCRQEYGLEPEHFVIGHLGRLAEEKNLKYLSKAVARYMKQDRNARFLVVGGGDLEDWMRQFFKDEALAGRVEFTGSLSGKKLYDAYAAMDLFVFASGSETQGLVLVEAMAAGNPVVALDASGAREVVNGDNGMLLLADASVEAFASGIETCVQHMFKDSGVVDAAKQTAEQFSVSATTAELEQIYKKCLSEHKHEDRLEAESVFMQFEQIAQRILAEWELVTEKASAAKSAFHHTEDEAEIAPK